MDQGYQSIIVDLHISAQEYQKMYARIASSVRVKARDGRRVQFPANLLRDHVRAEGVLGTFEFVLDENNKVTRFTRLR